MVSSGRLHQLLLTHRTFLKRQPVSFHAIESVDSQSRAYGKVSDGTYCTILLF